MDRKQGSMVVLVLWIMFLFPIAIWYWFNRVWSEEIFHNIKPQAEIDAAESQKSQPRQEKEMNSEVKAETKGGK